MPSLLELGTAARHVDHHLRPARLEERDLWTLDVSVWDSSGTSDLLWDVVDDDTNIFEES